MFLGTMRGHKGVEDLVTALGMLGNSSLMLVLVGLEEGLYKEKLRRLCETNVKVGFRSFGLQPFAKMPEFLAMSDMLVIPSVKIEQP